MCIVVGGILVTLKKENGHSLKAGNLNGDGLPVSKRKTEMGETTQIKGITSNQV